MHGCKLCQINYKTHLVTLTLTNLNVYNIKQGILAEEVLVNLW